MEAPHRNGFFTESGELLLADWPLGYTPRVVRFGLTDARSLLAKLESSHRADGPPPAAARTRQ